MKCNPLGMLILMIALSCVVFICYAEEVAACKVLVVMSFSEDFFWNRELK